MMLTYMVMFVSSDDSFYQITHLQVCPGNFRGNLAKPSFRLGFRHLKMFHVILGG